jgi:hypothetical protein
LVEDPSLRFPPQLDLVAAVAPLLFRGGGVGRLAQGSLLQAAAQQDHRVSLFVVHHSGVCGLLAGALATAFEVLPRDLAPFHALAAARRREQARPQAQARRRAQARSNDGNGRDGSVLAGLHVAFAEFTERWAFCDGVLRAAWTPRAADAWALQTRPQRARSRAGSFGRRGSSLETLVGANCLGRGHDEASVYAGAPRSLSLCSYLIRVLF